MKIKKNKGFTLVELLVVIAIIGIFIAISTPHLTKIINNEKVETINEELMMDIETAKITAITSNEDVYIEFFQNGSDSWRLKTDKKVLKVRNIEDIPAYLEYNYSILKFSSLGFLQNDTGTTINNAFIKVCNENKESNEDKYGNLIRLNPFGKIKVTESICQ